MLTAHFSIYILRFMSRRWGLPPHPRFPQRSDCFADGSLPRLKGALGRWELPPPTPPLSAAPGLSCRRLATASNETLSTLRAHLRTRKAIRCRDLQQRNGGCTHHRRRTGGLFYRGK
jgi:hypothetical protein